jgi:predicted unusual protein kinase regulating ubiquinone biosynthesis (AarF/ABC1/UbiB family)
MAARRVSIGWPCYCMLTDSKIGLAASLGYGVASEIVRRTGSGVNDQQSSVMMTEANIARLVSKLSQMRGAALKLGQFMSIQGALSCRIL